MSGPRIRRVETTRLNIPLVQPITMSFGTLSLQHVVLVRLWDDDGVQGTGEASVLGGPYWNEDSAEGVQAAIEKYIAPAFVGQRLTSLNGVAARLARLVKGNAAARHAFETAALDLLARSSGMSAAVLLGGACHSHLPVAWTVSTGSTAGDIEAGERAFAERGHRRFKLKFGRESAADDVARAEAIVAAFAGRATVVADVNQGWDEVTAARWLPRLQEVGLEAIEQPLPAENLDAVARLRTGLGLDVIADEALARPASVLSVLRKGAATALALKPGRDGGITASRRVAAIGEAGGLDLYGGTMLETSLGTAASALLFATLPTMRFGTELFGPLRLAHDIATRPLTVIGGQLAVPNGPGLGIELDEDVIGFATVGRVPPVPVQDRNVGAVGPRFEEARDRFASPAPAGT